MMDVATRIRTVRNLTGLNLKTFCEKHDLSFSTWSKIETGIKKVSPKLLNKFLFAAKIEGIIVSDGWLISGTGEAPQTLGPSNTSSINANLPITYFVQNIALGFIKSFSDSEILTINDDSCYPEFTAGDIVGGVEICLDRIEGIRAKEQRFLIKLKDGSLCLRLIDSISKEGFLTVRTINKYPAKGEYIQILEDYASIYNLSFILRKSFLN